MRYCIACGNKLLDGDIYCGHCGAAVPDWLREAPDDDEGSPSEAQKSVPHSAKQPSEPNQPRASLTKINGKQRRNIKEHSNARHAASSSRPMRTRVRHAASNSKMLPKELSNGSIKPSTRLKRGVQRKKKPHRQT